MLLPVISVTHLECIPGDKEGLFYYLELLQLVPGKMDATAL